MVSLGQTCLAYLFREQSVLFKNNKKDLSDFSLMTTRFSYRSLRPNVLHAVTM